jgi:hypothetical protein
MPQSCIWLASVPVNTSLSAIKHNPSNDIYYIPNPTTNEYECSEPPTGEIISQSSNRPTDWHCNSETLFGYRVSVHPHDLVFVPSVDNEWACDTCSANFGQQPGFLCSKYYFTKDRDERDCNWGICSACYYELFMKTTLPFIEEELSLLMEGERWWGGEIFKPRVTFAQNQMVLKMVEKYRQERLKEVPAPETPDFPDQEFNIPFFSALAGTEVDYNYFKDYDSGGFSDADLGIVEVAGEDLEAMPDDEGDEGDEGAEEGDEEGDEGGDEEGDNPNDVEIQLELSGKPSDPDTKYVLLENE